MVPEFLPAIADTTIRVIMNPSCTVSEMALIDLPRNLKESNNFYVPFVINKYESQFLDSSFYNRVFKDDLVFYKGLNLSNLVHGLDRKAFTHLYILSSQYDLQKAIRVHFVYFIMQRVSPRFILFWSATPKNAINLKKEFQNLIFYKSFMDFRFLIVSQSESGPYNVWLICVICLLHRDKNLQDSYLTPIKNSTTGNLKKVWIEKHKNHHGLVVNRAFGLHAVKIGSRVYGPADVFKEAFNASITQSFQSMEYTVTKVYMGEPFSPTNVRYVFLSSSFPAVHVADSGSV